MNPRRWWGVGGGLNVTESSPASQPVVPSVGANSAQTDWLRLDPDSEAHRLTVQVTEVDEYAGGSFGETRNTD